jgi:hypothetical protein
MSEMMIACFDIDLYSEHEDSMYKWPPHDANIYLTKSASEIVRANALLKIMSDFFVICMLRDPRDSIASIHNLEPHHYWSNLGYWKRFMSIKCWVELQSHPRFIIVRYEDLVTEPDKIQNSLMQRMPFLAKRALFSNYHAFANPSDNSILALNGLRPPERSSIGNWRDHLSRVAGQIHEHGSITDDLIAFGYEKDDRWLQCLKGVEPDFGPGRIPYYDPERNFRIRKRWMYLQVLLARLGHARPIVLARTIARNLFGKNKNY